jgi:hypothetical protein
MYNAKQDLVKQLMTDAQCLNAAKSVFSKVTFGGFLGFFTSPVSTSQFVGYLQRAYFFYDGTQSTLDYHDALCGQAMFCNVTGLNPPQTVKDQFSSGSTRTAITVTPSEPLKTFWQPAFTAPGPGDNGFGVGIDPTTFGINKSNEANLFHEALHGMTNLSDGQLQSELSIGPPSVNISIYIRDNVLNSCPTFR